VQHWKEGGHDNLCKKIKRSGGAEQYNANNRYTEAVAVAAEACAEDTKGQTCYICTQALHWKTKEGLVRMCACRGTAGFAHVSCLAEQAKILVAEAEENNLGNKAWNERFARWHTCSLCEQEYHGVVRFALGCACWKMYLGRPEEDWARRMAMRQLGNGLFAAEHFEDALSMRETELSMLRRLGASESSILDAQSNIALTYGKLGRYERALQIERDVYFGRISLHGEEHEFTLQEASGYVLSLLHLGRFQEVKSVSRKTIPVARRVFGGHNGLMLEMNTNYAIALYKDPTATLDDLREAVTTLEETELLARRVLGGVHPFAAEIEKYLRESRAALRDRESGDVESIREAVVRWWRR